MLESFRSLAGSLWSKLLMALLVLSFAVWGIGDMIRHPNRNLTVATVGHAPISGDEYARALRQETENMRRTLGENASPEMLKALNLPQRVLRQTIARTLVRLESESLGLVPSDADVVRRIRENPAFQDSKGNFDKSLLEAMLRNSNLLEKTYVEQLRQEMATSLLIDTLLTAAPVSDAAVHTLLAAHQEQRSATFYTLGPSLVMNMPEPDAAQLGTYYKDHHGQFTAPEYRMVSYVTVTAANVHDDTAISDEELQSMYKERIEEFRNPERRTVEQLLYDSEDKAKQAEALLKSGKSFEQVAKDVVPLNKNSLSLGKVTRRNMIEGAANSVFSLRTSEVTEPIKSAFGWHIFHVSAIEQPSTTSFDEAKPTFEKEIKQRNIDEGLNKLANKLEDALAGGSTLAEAAKDFGLSVSVVHQIDREGKPSVAGKPEDWPVSKDDKDDAKKFLDTVFKTDEKSESALITAKNGIYYIVRVDSITPEHLRLLDEVKVQVVTGWQKEERSKRLGKLAEDIAAKFSDSAGRNAVVEQYGLKAATISTIKRNSQEADNMPLPPELVADVFSRKPGQGTGAYPTANGEYMVAVVNAVIPMSDKDADMKSMLADTHDQLKGDVQNEILDQYTRYLENKYPVSLNESALQSVAR